MIVTSLDEISPSFGELKETVREVAMEVMSKAGNYAREGARDAMKSYSHHWFRKKYKDGEVKPYYSKTSTKKLGLRISNRGGRIDNPRSMSNLITSFLMEKSETLIVGGTHKGFRPLKRDKGQVVGYSTYVKGVSRQSQSIINKMDTGELTSYYKKLPTEFKNAKYVTRPFMKIGFDSAEGKIKTTLTSEYIKIFNSALHKQKVQVKVRKIA